MGAQFGNHAQGTRNHRSATSGYTYFQPQLTSTVDHYTTLGTTVRLRVCNKNVFLKTEMICSSHDAPSSSLTSRYIHRTTSQRQVTVIRWCKNLVHFWGETENQHHLVELDHHYIQCWADSKLVDEGRTRHNVMCLVHTEFTVSDSKLVDEGRTRHNVMCLQFTLWVHCEW